MSRISEIDDLHHIATVIAERAGAISECEVHSGTYLTNSDTEAEKLAYAIGSNMLKNGEVGGSRKSLMDAIQTVMAEAAWECASCEKNMRD